MARCTSYWHTEVTDQVVPTSDNDWSMACSHKVPLGNQLLEKHVQPILPLKVLIQKSYCRDFKEMFTNMFATLIILSFFPHLLTAISCFYGPRENLPDFSRAKLLYSFLFLFIHWSINLFQSCLLFFIQFLPCNNPRITLLSLQVIPSKVH